jgi:nucleoside-diphosphate-sugar epimerase
VLITGGGGLVGTALAPHLRRLGLQPVVFDHAVDHRDDTRDAAAVRHAVASVVGVVHLAAISRVAWAHADPAACWATNVGGTLRVLEALQSHQWVLFASSREVYGTVAGLATESTPCHALNVYARAKLAGEELVAGHDGPVGIVRLSNAYGTTADHADRVVPAFARAAARGEAVRVDGAERTFDFVHVDDAARGIALMVHRLQTGLPLPTLHLTTGQGTSLGALGELAVRHGAAGMVAGPERDYDVERFVGDPSRARAVLGWQARRRLVDGFAELVEAFRRAEGPRAVPQGR